LCVTISLVTNGKPLLILYNIFIHFNDLSSNKKVTLYIINILPK